MFAAFSRYRPRILTLVVLLVVAAVLVLANLSTEISRVEDGDSQLRPLTKVSGGWPLIWHRYIIYMGPIPAVDAIGWYYSAGRLAGSLPIWLAMLATPVSACEWLLRRYRPRLRWSLRTMLVAVGLVAAFCAWFTAARRRAGLQDRIIAATKVSGPLGPSSGSCVVLERWGPKWLDFLGADPYRRCIVGVKLGEVNLGSSLADEQVERRLKRLTELPALRYLSLAVDRLTPAMTEALKEMRKLRMLSIAQHSGTSEQTPRECLAAIGELTQLERLNLENMVIASESLKCLEHLNSLKSLGVAECSPGDQSDDEDGADFPPMFGQLPALPQLEELDMQVYDVDNRDLRRLAALPRLKSLSLVFTDVTSEGLAELGALKSLEELEIHDCLSDLVSRDVVVSAAALESLIKVKHLKTLHLDRYAGSKVVSEGRYTLTLDNGGEIAVPASEAGDFLRALTALREAKPGIVIDSRDYSYEWRAEREIPWDAESGFMNYRSMLLQLPPGAFRQTIPAEVDNEFRSLKW